jgi:hypothetical protein
VSVWGALAGGFVGTLALTTILRAASEFQLTRIDLPFLLGTALTSDRARAKAIGYGLHFVAGLVFAVVYYVLFAAMFAGTALVNVMLPLVHPRMGSPLTAAPTTARLEAPGFLLLNYGLQTPLITVVAHVAYGALVGGFTSIGA